MKRYINYFKISFYKVYVILAILIFGYLVISKGEIFTYDSIMYLGAFIHVQPLYTIFLYLFKFTIGDQIHDFVIVTQFAILIISILIFTNIVSKIFNFSIVTKTILFTVSSLPIILPNLRITNKIVTESLAYSFFLIFVAYFLRGLKYSTLKDYQISLLGLYFLLLTRGQFLSIIPAILVVLFFKYRRRLFKTNIKYIFLLTLGLSIISSYTEKAIYGVTRNQFESRLLKNLNLSGIPMFLSEEEDVIFMPDAESKYLFRQSYKKLKNNNLLANQLPSSYTIYEKYNFYNSVVPRITNMTIHDIACNLYMKNHEDYNASLVYADKLIERMLYQLIKARPRVVLKMIFINASEGYGSIAILIVLIILLLWILYRNIKEKSNYNEYMLFFILLILGNISLIALAGHSIRRFYFYYDIIWILFLLTLLQKYKIDRLNSFLFKRN